jgi:hypothetical protein
VWAGGVAWHVTFKYATVRAMRRWAESIPFSECLHLVTGDSSEQPLQFLDLVCPCDKDIPDAPHPCGRRPLGHVRPEQVSECSSGDFHSASTFQIEMYLAD